MTEFKDLGLAAPLLRALGEEGYTTPTPIQTQAIPGVLDGRDLLGIAQTGTGKTAAFMLPILQRLAAAGAQGERPPRFPHRARALILSPTRELSAQIAESARAYGRHTGLTVAVVFGGVGKGPQAKAMARGVDVLVATPGRLLDLMADRAVNLDRVETFVLDEADQMLDLGFIVPIRRIVRALPAARQTLFFSATMPREIGVLADELLRDPLRVSVTPVATPVERITQRVIMTDGQDKRTILARLLAQETTGRTLVFTRTKHGADRVVRHLEGAGIPAVAIHGNKSQSQRERALAGFRDGSTRVLIATDIAARGIDVADVTHVVNVDLPHVPESYVHRIGRTARAGADGAAISLCARDEVPLLRAIERLIRKPIPVDGAPLPAPGEAAPAADAGRQDLRDRPRQDRPRQQQAQQQEQTRRPAREQGPWQPDARPERPDADRRGPPAAQRSEAGKRSGGPGRHSPAKPKLAGGNAPPRRAAANDDRGELAGLGFLKPSRPRLAGRG